MGKQASRALEIMLKRACGNVMAIRHTRSEKLRAEVRQFCEL
jgi:hypothetical protein